MSKDDLGENVHKTFFEAYGENVHKMFLELIQGLISKVEAGELTAEQAVWIVITSGDSMDDQE